jgi:hypothetical protein
MATKTWNLTAFADAGPPIVVTGVRNCQLPGGWMLGETIAGKLLINSARIIAVSLENTESSGLRVVDESGDRHPA